MNIQRDEKLYKFNVRLDVWFASEYGWKLKMNKWWTLGTTVVSASGAMKFEILFQGSIIFHAAWAIWKA